MESPEKGRGKSKRRQGLDALKDFKFPESQPPEEARRAHSLSSAATNEGGQEMERTPDENVDHAFKQMAEASREKRDLGAVYEHVLQALGPDELDRFNDRLRTEGPSIGIDIMGQEEKIDQPAVAEVPTEVVQKPAAREHLRGDEPYAGDELESAHEALRGRLAALPLEADHSENILKRIEAANDPLRVRTIAQELHRLEQIHKPAAPAEVEKPVDRAPSRRAERKAQKAAHYESEQLPDAQANLARRLEALGHLDEAAKTALSERIQGAKKSTEVQKLSRELGHLEKLGGLADRLQKLVHTDDAAEVIPAPAPIEEKTPPEESTTEKSTKPAKKKKAPKEKAPEKATEPEKTKEPEKIFHDDVKKATGVSHEELLKRLHERQERRGGGGSGFNDTPIFGAEVPLGSYEKTLKDIFADKAEHERFVNAFLPARGKESVDVMLALGNGTLLTPEQDAWLEKMRGAYNLRRA
ncbi:MAG TPA: hypothetical protein VHD38_01810, partial [Candidatus Paceibacterota bacterium]|nr:hypothetical protein [Candidatus Paceibacterota bacterium]